MELVSGGSLVGDYGDILQYDMLLVSRLVSQGYCPCVIPHTGNANPHCHHCEGTGRILVKELTQEVFARWMFEEDQKDGLYHQDDTWESVDQDTRDLYNTEADAYFHEVETHNWPEDIKNRAAVEEYQLPDVGILKGR